jgi:hypothetical protein
MLNEIRVMDTFVFAIDGRTARVYAIACDRPVVGRDKDYIKGLASLGTCSLRAPNRRGRQVKRA